MGLFSLNVKATYLLNVGLDLYALLTLFIIYFSSRNRINSKTYGQRLFKRTQVSLIALLVSDIITWLINGVPGKSWRIVNYISNMVFLCLAPFLITNWMRYAWYRVKKEPFPSRANIIFCIVPQVVLIILAVTTPWTKRVFYLDENNVYHRGVNNYIYSAAFLVYILYTSLMAFFKYRRTVLAIDREEYLAISSFIIVPVIAGITQAIVYGLSLTPPAAVFSIVLVYLNMQDREISQDSLTGLNNRSSLDSYVQPLVGSGRQKIALILFDVNSFKAINDTFGHLNGDKALVRLSAVLKQFFGKTDTFLARYGGDEFVAILRDCDESSVTERIALVNSAIEKLNSEKVFPFNLSVSAGYCMCPSAGITTSEELFQAADNNMYKNKNAYHDHAQAFIKAGVHHIAAVVHDSENAVKK